MNDKIFKTNSNEAQLLYDEELIDRFKHTFTSNKIYYDKKEYQETHESASDNLFQKAKEELEIRNQKFDNSKLDFNYEKMYKSVIEDVKIKELTISMQTDINKFYQLTQNPSDLNPVEDIFGIKRGICENCLENCKGYMPSHFTVDNFPSACFNCKCGATAHKVLEMDSSAYTLLAASIKNDILPLLHIPTMSDDSINFDSILVVFSINKPDLNSKDNNEINNFLNLLKEGGFDILFYDIKVTSFPNNNFSDEPNAKNNLMNNLLNYTHQNNIININEKNKLSRFEFSKIFLKDIVKSFIKKDTTFERINKFSNMNEIIANESNREKLNTNITTDNFLSIFYSETNNKGSLENENNLMVKENTNKYTEIFKKPTLCLCLTNNKNDVIQYFEKFYYAIKTDKNLQYSITNNISMVYYSKTKAQAFWDLQAIFPDLFRIRKSLCFITEKPNLFNSFENFNEAEKSMNATLTSYLYNSNLNNFKSKKKTMNNRENPKQSINQSINNNHIEDMVTTNQVETSYVNSYKKQFSLFNDFIISNSIFPTGMKCFDDLSNLINEFTSYLDSNSSFLNNFINYISRSGGLNCNTSNNFSQIKSAVTFLSKIGNFNSFNPNGFWNDFDIINVSTMLEQEILTNILFQKEVSYKRVLVIFRPILVRNGLVDPILNIFKLNNFFILKRKIEILNQRQVEFLYSIEFDNNQIIEFEDYYKMMTDYNVEIVVLSKFGALEDTKLICGGGTKESDGNLLTNVNLLRSLDSSLSQIDLKVDKKYEDKIELNKMTVSDNGSFNDISCFLNINTIFHNVLKEKKKIYSNFDYKTVIELKRNIVKFCSLFNIFIYNSKKEEIIDKEINYFFPEFGDMQEILVMLKRSTPCTEVFNEQINSSNNKDQLIIDNIKLTFEKMNFEILDSVQYKLNEDEFGNLFDNYVSTNTISPFEYSISKDLLLSSEVDILRLIKPGAMLDLVKIIGKLNPNFLKNPEQSDLNYDKLSLIKQRCYLLTLSSDIEYYYPSVKNNISIIEGSYLLKQSAEGKMKDQSIIEILNSCLKCTVGENIRDDSDNMRSKVKLVQRYLKFFHYNDENKINEYFIGVLDNYIFSKWNSSSNYNNFFEFIYFDKNSINSQISFFVESNNLGFYEVRIPMLEDTSTNSDNFEYILSKHYHYSDEHFFKHLSDKYKNIVLEKIPFIIDSNSIESLGLNSNINNMNIIQDNMRIIQKRLFYKTKFECNNIFYIMCSLIPNNVMTPQNYHYRIKPDDITMDIRRIYDVEEFAGLFFIEMVTQDFMKYRQSENIKKENFRFSLPAYLWGRKLAGICKNLEFPNDISNGIENSGPLIYSIKDEKIKGIINPNYLLEYDQYLYVNILYDLKVAHETKNGIDFEIFDRDQYKVVEDKLLNILESEIFKFSRKEENIVLMPFRINEQNLRITKMGCEIINENFKNDQNGFTSNESNNMFSDLNLEPKLSEKLSEKLGELFQKRKTNLTEMDREIKKHEFFKGNEEMKITEDISNKYAMLVDTFCQKGSKFKLYACFQYLLNIVYKKLSRKSFLLNNNEEEYDKMIDALLIGFNNNVNFDSPEVNDQKCGYNSYKIEYFLHVLSEIKFFLNELNFSKKNLLSSENKINVLVNSKNSYGSQNKIKELEKVKKILQSNINELNINIEILFFELYKFDVKHVVLMKGNNKIKILPKERYHIPMFFNEYWERDLKNDKFKITKTYDKNFVMDKYSYNRIMNNNILSQSDNEMSKSESLRVLLFL